MDDVFWEAGLDFDPAYQAGDTLGSYIHAGRVYLTGTLASKEIPPSGAPGSVTHWTNSSTLLTSMPAAKCPSADIALELEWIRRFTQWPCGIAPLPFARPISQLVPATLHTDGSLTLDSTPAWMLETYPDRNPPILNHITFRLGNVSWPVAVQSDVWTRHDLNLVGRADDGYIETAPAMTGATIAAHGSRVHMTGRVNVDFGTFNLGTVPAPFRPAFRSWTSVNTSRGPMHLQVDPDGSLSLAVENIFRSEPPPFDPDNPQGALGAYNSITTGSMRGLAVVSDSGDLGEVPSIVGDVFTNTNMAWPDPALDPLPGSPLGEPSDRMNGVGTQVGCCCENDGFLGICVTCYLDDGVVADVTGLLDLTDNYQTDGITTGRTGGVGAKDTIDWNVYGAWGVVVSDPGVNSCVDTHCSPFVLPKCGGPERDTAAIFDALHWTSHPFGTPTLRSDHHTTLGTASAVNEASQFFERNSVASYDGNEDLDAASRLLLWPAGDLISFTQHTDATGELVTTSSDPAGAMVLMYGFHEQLFLREGDYVDFTGAGWQASPSAPLTRAGPGIIRVIPSPGGLRPRGQSKMVRP